MFAAGLIFLGTLISTIPVLPSHFVHPVLDQWGIAIVLITCGILICSVWIRKIAEHRAASREVNTFNDEPLDSDSDPDPWGPEVEITVRLTHRGSGILGKRRCIVSIHYPKEGAHAVEHGSGNSTGRGGGRCKVLHQKLLFWV